MGRRARVVRRVLEGHLEGQREAVESLADPVRRRREVSLAGCLARISVLALEVGIEGLERLT